MLGLQMAASRVVRPGFAPGILASGSTSQTSVSPSLKWGPSPPLLDRGAARCPHNICFWEVPVPNIDCVGFLYPWDLGISLADGES